MNPLASIIISTYNNAEFITKAIESVFNQSWKNFEIIIIDDASRDSTEDVLSKYLIDHRIIYKKNSLNLGVSKSKNLAVSLARGKYIFPLDADDIWSLPTKLEMQVKVLQNNPKISLLGTWAKAVDKLGNDLYELKYDIEDNLIRKKMLQVNSFIHSSVAFPKEAFNTVEGYNPKYKFSQDYDLWMRLGQVGKMFNLPNYSVKYLINEKGLSVQNSEKQMEETLEIVRQNKKNYPNFLYSYTRWQIRRLNNLRKKLSKNNVL